MLSSNEIATGSGGSTSKCCWPFGDVVLPHSAAISTRIPPDPLPARGLHPAPSVGPTGASEQEGPLRSSVPYQCGNPSRSGAQSETPRRRDWLLQRVAYLSLEGLRPAKSYENCPELRYQRPGAARSRLQWSSRGRTPV